MIRLPPLLLPATVVLLAVVPAAAAAAAPAGVDKPVQAFLDQNCARCHGEQKQKGSFRVDRLQTDFGRATAAGLWADVMHRISSGEMPPEGEPRPSADAAARAVEWIAGRVKEGEKARLAARERVTFHKLTRREYANTVRDLLGVTYDVADPTGLAEDSTWQGFERVGAVQSVSPAHLEKYYAAAEAVLAEALPAAPPKRLKKHRDVWDLRYHGQRKKGEQLGLAGAARVDLWSHDSLPVSGEFPQAGEYRMRIRASGMKPPAGRAPRVSVYAKGLDRMLFEADVVTPEDVPATLEFTFHVPAGYQELVLTCEAPGPSNLPRHGRTHSGRFFTTIKESATGRHPWQYKLSDEDGVPIRPFLIVDWVDLEGPIGPDGAVTAGGPTPAERWLFPAGGKEDLPAARATLTSFAERAFRRPVRAAEVERFVRLVEAELAAGETYRPALKTGLLAVLCSKDFLYLVEGSPDRADGRLTDHELAARLSYFFWSTAPDEQLRKLAAAGQLANPDVLRGEVGRMLRDPRAERFGGGFPREWLQLGKVGMFPPDKKLYPAYDAHLEQSMVAEGVWFFRVVLAKNLSAREFLSSDWTMLNARLAEHYGIAGVEGDTFRRVPLRPEDHRGGLLTQAGVLSLTSDGQRHRPVHRGKWVLEALVNRPPPPPPANVKPIETPPPGAPKATLRARLEAHKADATCAACHRNIDPLGLAFEQYDAIGRWRTTEAVRGGTGDDPPVDAGGELPDGRSFADAAGLKQLLLADADRFAAALTEKLATYALRRTMTVDDRAALDAVVAAAKASDYRLADLVEALVASELFRQR